MGEGGWSSARPRPPASYTDWRRHASRVIEDPNSSSDHRSMAAPTTLRLVDPTPQQEPLGGATIALPDDDTRIDFSDDGAMRVVHPDGSATIDFNPDRAAGNADSDDFYRNLANEIDDGRLATIA